MKHIFLWCRNPIDIDIDLYKRISNSLSMQITIMYFYEMSSDRVKCGFSDNTAVTQQKTNSLDEAIALIEKKKDELHVFFGMLGQNKALIEYAIKLKPDIKIGVVSERHNPFGNIIIRGIKYIIRKAEFTRCAGKWSRNIGMLLTYGQMGVSYFRRCGFRDEVLFPFIYCTNNADVYNAAQGHGKYLCPESHEKLNFIYIGRLGFGPKGVDILMKAFDKFKDDRWSLDIAGGYGNNSQEIIKWTETGMQTRYIGPLGKDDVIAHLRNYDVCIIPSRREGYNTISAQAIAAHIGCIVTDESVSGELIQNADSGLVIKANSVSELCRAIEFCIQNRDSVALWKKNAESFENLVELSSVSMYVTNIIRKQFFDEIQLDTSCPWLKNSR